MTKGWVIQYKMHTCKRTYLEEMYVSGWREVKGMNCSLTRFAFMKEKDNIIEYDVLVVWYLELSYPIYFMHRIGYHVPAKPIRVLPRSIQHILILQFFRIIMQLL